MSMIRKYHNHKLQTTPWHPEVRDTVSQMTNEDILREPMPHTKTRESVDHVPKLRESTLLEPTLPVRARNFRDQVLEQTGEKLLMDPEDLFRGLYHVRGLKTDVAKTIVMGQVGLARRRDVRYWLESGAYFGTIMFESKWVEESIGKRKRKPSHQAPHSAARNTPARVRPRANPDKSAKRDSSNNDLAVRSLAHRNLDLPSEVCH